ncbi:hypothetical protein [Roseibium sp. M-1]
MTETSLLFLIVPAFFVCFGLFWSGIVFAIAYLGGWAALARAYPALEPPHEPPMGQSWSWTSARFGLVTNYRNCVNVTVSDAGLYLRPVIFFRMGHRPILIPWRAIEAARRTDLYFTTMIRLDISLGNGSSRRVAFYGKPLSEAIETHLRRWKVPVE